MSKEKRETYTMSEEELQMLTETFTLQTDDDGTVNWGSSLFQNSRNTERLIFMLAERR